MERKETEESRKWENLNLPERNSPSQESLMRKTSDKVR